MKKLLLIVLLLFLSLSLFAAVYEIPNVNLDIELSNKYSVSLDDSVLIAKNSDNDMVIVIKAIGVEWQKAKLNPSSNEIKSFNDALLKVKNISKDNLEKASSYKTKFATFSEIEYEVPMIEFETMSYNLKLDNYTLSIDAMFTDGIEKKDREEIRKIISTIKKSSGKGLKTATPVSSSTSEQIFSVKETGFIATIPAGFDRLEADDDEMALYINMQDHQVLILLSMDMAKKIPFGGMFRGKMDMSKMKSEDMDKMMNEAEGLMTISEINGVEYFAMNTDEMSSYTTLQRGLMHMVAVNYLSSSADKSLIETIIQSVKI